MLKAYVHPLSAPSNKVLFTLHALNMDYERVLIDLAQGEQLQEAFKALNPFGKIPVIDHDGFVLYESGAIISYLARLQKSSLYPSTFHDRARVDQWCHFAAEVLQLPLQRVFFNRVVAPMIGVPADEAAITQGLAQLDAYLPVLDAHFEHARFLCGDDLTLADITLASVLDPAVPANIDLTSHAHLGRWWSGIRDQEFYTQTHAHFGAGILGQP